MSYASMPPTPTAERAVPRDFTVLAYSQGFTHWLYRSPHPPHICTQATYWNQALEAILTGDLLTLVTPVGTMQRFFRRSPETGHLKLEPLLP